MSNVFTVSIVENAQSSHSTRVSHNANTCQNCSVFRMHYLQAAAHTVCSHCSSYILTASIDGLKDIVTVITVTNINNNARDKVLGYG